MSSPMRREYQEPPRIFLAAAERFRKCEVELNYATPAILAQNFGMGKDESRVGKKLHQICMDSGLVHCYTKGRKLTRWLQHIPPRSCNAGGTV